LGPIVLVNTRSFFDPCLDLLERCIAEGFMDARHGEMWQVVREPEQVIAALADARPWPADAIRFAAL
jgi:predicted Rossmann-fold nucleotide-binding protein